MVASRSSSMFLEESRGSVESEGIDYRSFVSGSVLDRRMDKKETILLDARLRSVIDNSAFGAELPNGHRFVAYFYRSDAVGKSLQIGDRVVVEMSPFDMSKGRLVLNEE